MSSLSIDVRREQARKWHLFNDALTWAAKPPELSDYELTIMGAFGWPEWGIVAIEMPGTDRSDPMIGCSLAVNKDLTPELAKALISNAMFALADMAQNRSYDS